MILIELLTPVFFCLVLFHVSSAGIYRTFHAKETKFLQLVQDPETEDIYIGARNGIYHLDAKLKLNQDLTVGPYKDSQDCLPRRKGCKSKTLRNNNIVVLEIEPASRYLFACGTVDQGACMKYNLSDIKKSSRFQSSKAENFVGSNTSTVAFFSLNPVSNTSILYVAMSYDGRMHEAFPKTMSERILTEKNGYYNLAYRKSYLGIPTNKDMRSTYPVRYIYGFKLNNFIYYVSNQENKTYIGRVCENSEFYYYVETELKCWNNTKVWTLATATKFIGDELFVTYWNEDDNQSLLCVHQINEILDAMRDTINNCYRRTTYDIPKIPAWIAKDKRCIETYDYKITADTCGMDESNGYISGSPSVSVGYFVYNRKFTAIQSYEYDKTIVYLLGTANGHLLKVISYQPNKFHLIMDNDISNGTGQAIQPDLEVDKQKDHVYALTGSTVVRFPLKSCSVYKSCSTCVLSQDPLNCGWCHDTCTTSSECKNGWNPECCVPKITSISPTKGPVKGGTKLTIKGEYFSNNDPDIKINISIGKKPCRLDKYNNTNIVCFTSKSKNGDKGNVHVIIRASRINTKQPKIEGEGISKEIFYFMVPEIYNITPVFGPISGGTKCNITGKNLDIGSTLNLYIKDHEILIQKRTQDKIFALTQEISQPIEGQLKLQMDNQTLWTKNSFAFKPDPKVTGVNHSTQTIKSGGIDIVFMGRNLNTVQKPMLSGVIVKTMDTLPPEKCHANKDGTKLYCKTPVLNDSSDATIPVDLQLHMDGVVELDKFPTTHPEFSRIQYGPDPILYPFDTKHKLFFYGKTSGDVIIEGKHITDIIQEDDIHIQIGNSECHCHITSLTSTFIHCKPSPWPPEIENVDHQKFEVVVTIGYRNYRIGWLLESTNTAKVNIPIIALVLILICIVLVTMFLFYYMWRKKLLFFKEKSSLPAARYTANDQVHFGENGRLIIAANEYTERQNFQPASPVFIGATSFPIIDESILLVLGDKKLLIPKESLQITEKIGQGHFGCVYRALYRKPGEKGEMLVAVKTLHKDHPRDMDVQGFLDEALIMKDFDHDNILSLIGICLGKDHMPLVVLPYMAHGDLLSYLRNVNNQPTVKDLIIFGISIASGMDYLASLKFVHRDLAARNCMLNDKLVVKVADFGLSRDIYERDYYSSDNKKSKLPVKWMALESLENGTYNTKTDVWSYGVVLWELFTRGVNPYPTVDNWDMPKYLKLGRRMDKPDYCPNRIYDIMLRCWEFDQNLRPDFATVVQELTELSEMEKHRDLPCYQKTPYVNVEC